MPSKKTAPTTPERDDERLASTLWRQKYEDAEQRIADLKTQLTAEARIAELQKQLWAAYDKLEDTKNERDQLRHKAPPRPAGDLLTLPERDHVEHVREAADDLDMLATQRPLSIESRRAQHDLRALLAIVDRLAPLP
jgi:chromosome segregation ATPase